MINMLTNTDNDYLNLIKEITNKFFSFFELNKDKIKERIKKRYRAWRQGFEKDIIINDIVCPPLKIPYMDILTCKLFLDKINYSEILNSKMLQAKLDDFFIYKFERRDAFFLKTLYILCACRYRNSKIEILININSLKILIRIINIIEKNDNINKLYIIFAHLLLHELYHIYHLHIFGGKIGSSNIYEKKFEEDKDYDEFIHILKDLSDLNEDNIRKRINELKEYKGFFKDIMEKYKICIDGLIRAYILISS